MRKLVTLTSSLTLMVGLSSGASFATSPPTLSTPNGVYWEPADLISPYPITISASSGSIFFTTDGSIPSSASTPYTSGLSIQSSTQINAIAISSGVSSSVTSGFYNLDSNIANLAVPKMWFLDCFGPAMSGTVSFWPDMSLNNNNATQSTTANQPTFIGNAVNSTQALSFNGTSDSLQLPSLAFTNSGMTIFAVINPTTLSNAQILNFSGATAPQNLIGLGVSSTGVPQFSIYNSAGTSSTSVASSSPLPAKQFHLIEAVQGDINSTTSTLFIDGIQVGQNTAMNLVPAATLTNNFIGKSSSSAGYFNGDIAELQIFSTPLNSSQRAAIEAYLISKFQIPSQVPTAPIISTGSGSLTGPTQVAVVAQPGAIIHATTDGTTPTSLSPVITGPIAVNYSLTLKAIAVTGTSQSSISSASYTLPAQYPAPVAGGPTLKINLTLPSTAIP